MKDAKQRSISEKIIVSIIFGFLGFYANFHTVNLMDFAEFEVSLLWGLIFPLLIAEFWGWRYGLLSALAGGCQSMWFVWANDGYGLFYSVPVFTLWIVWHGWWADRRRQANRKWWHSRFIVEIFYRIVIEIGFLTVFRWLVSNNPPFWDSSITQSSVSGEWFLFVMKKHIITAYVLLLICDIFEKVKPIRTYFIPEEKFDFSVSTLIISLSIFTGIVMWFFHSILDYLFVYNGIYDLIEITFTKIPPSSALARAIIFLTSIITGLLLTRIHIKVKSNRDKLIEMESNYHRLIESCNDLIFTLNNDNQITYSNSEARNYLENRKVKGSNIVDLVKPEMRDVFRKCLQENEVTHENSRCEFQFDYFDLKKRIFEAQATILVNSEGKKNGVLLTVRDITERRIFEDKVVLAKQNWEKSFNSMQEIFMIVDTDHKILKINKRGLDIFHLKSEDVIGKNCYEIIYNFSEPEKFCPILETEISKKHTSTVSYSKKYGRHFAIRCSAVTDIEGNIVNYVFILNDISERVIMQKRLEEYHKDLEKKVSERTKDLKEKNDELQYYLKLFEKREFRIKELREQVNKLKKQLEDRY